MMKFTSITQKIAYTALFSAIAVVFNIITLPDTPLGTISFVYVPCMLAGIILGPWLGFTVGFVGDLLGCIIAPKGAISMLILISSGCIGLVAGLIFRLIKKDNLTIKMVICYFAVLIICTLGLGTAGNYIVTGFLQAKYTFWEYLLIVRLPKQPLILLINTFMTYAVIIIMAKQPKLRKLVVRHSR